jgi:hypothetical protein
MTVVLLAHRRIDLPNDRVSACGFDLPHEMTCWLSHRPRHGATPAAINNGLQLAGAEIAAAVTAQPADLLVVGGGPTGLGKPTSRPFSSTHSPTQTLEVFGHAVGKHLEVWNEVGVADDVEVQLQREVLRPPVEVTPSGWNRCARIHSGRGAPVMSSTARPRMA